MSYSISGKLHARFDGTKAHEHVSIMSLLERAHTANYIVEDDIKQRVVSTMCVCVWDLSGRECCISSGVISAHMTLMRLAVHYWVNN